MTPYHYPVAPNSQTSLPADLQMNTQDQSPLAYLPNLTAPPLDIESPSHLRTIIEEAPEPMEAAQALVRHLLVRLNDTLPTELQGESEREVVRRLAFIDKGERMHLIHMLHEMAPDNPPVQRLLERKLDNILQPLSTEERAEIVEQAIHAKLHRNTPSFILKVLRSSYDFNELKSLVGKVGVDTLLSLGDREIKNIVAITELGSQLRRLFDPPFSDLNPESRGDQLRARIEYASKLIRHPHLSVTEYGKKASLQLDYNTTLLDILETKHTTPHARQMVAEALRKKTLAEVKYGVLFTNESDHKLDESGAEWTLSELADAIDGLEKLPDALLLTTPHLFEITRVHVIQSKSILGVRHRDGRIEIADAAIHHPAIARFYPDSSTLQVTLIHEIGHGVQLGRDGGKIHEEHRDASYEEGDPRMDFTDFIHISGWEPIAKERYVHNEVMKAVAIDGAYYPLGEPTRFEGRDRIFFMDGEKLISIYADAHFTFDTYAKTSPWEDWSEAWTEYFLMPKRIMLFASEKYQFLEEELQHYHDTGSANLSALKVPPIN